MANDLSILIKAKFKDGIQGDLQGELNKVKDLKVDIGIDTKALVGLSNQIKELQKSLIQLKAPKLIDPDSLKESGAKAFDTISKIAEEYGKLGRLDFKNTFNPVTNELNGLSVSIQKADGLLQKLKFDLVSVGTLDNKKFILTNSTELDKTNAVLEKQEKKAADAIKSIVHQRIELRRQLFLATQEGNLPQTDIIGIINRAKTLDDIDAAKKHLESIKAIQADINKQVKQEGQDRLKAYQDSIKQQQNLADIIDKAHKQALADNKKLNEQLVNQTDSNSYKQENLVNSSNRLMAQYHGNVDEKALQELVIRIKEIDPASKTAEKDLKNLQLELARLQTQAMATSRTLVSELSHNLEKMLTWTAVSTVIFGSVAAFRALTSEIITIDTKLTELSKVMSSDTNFTKLMSDSVQVANEYGRSINEALDSLIKFAQAGYEANDAIQLMNATLLGSNVTGIEAGKMAEYLTSAIIQFGLKSSDAVDVINKLNEVDNNFAVTSVSLAQSISKVGSEAKVYGVTLSDLLGMTTAVSAATRETGNQVGTALKTSFARLSSSDVQKDLASIGVEVNDLNGNMKTATQIYGEVADKFGQLSRSQKMWISESLAGKYHLNEMIALLSNWKMAQDASSTSMNSFGSAIEENIKYMNSLEAQINKLKSSGEELANTLGESGLASTMRSSIGLFASFTKGLDSIIEENSLTKISVVALTGAIATLSVVGLAKTVIGLTETATATSKLATAIKLATAETWTFTAALAKNPLGLLAVGLSIGLGSWLVYKGRVKETADEMKNFGQEAEQANIKIKAVQDTLNSRGSTTKEDLSYYEGYVKEIANLYGKLQQIKDRQGNDALDFGKLPENIREISKATGIDITKYTSFSQLLGDIQTKLKGTSDELQKLRQNTQDGLKSDISVASIQQQLFEKYDQSTKSLDVYNKLLDDVAKGHNLSAAEALEYAKKENDLSQAITVENGVVKVNKELVEKLRDAKIDAFNKSVDNIKVELETQRKALAEKLQMYGIELNSLEQLSKARGDIQERQKQLAGTYNQLYQTNPELAKQVMDNIVDLAKNFQDVDKIEAAKKAIDDLQNKLDQGLKTTGVSTKENEKATAATDAYTLAINKLDLALDAIKNQLQDYPKYSEEYRKALAAEKKAIEEKIALAEKDLATMEKTGKAVSGKKLVQASTGSYSGTYSNIINKASSAYGIDANLIAAIIQQESSFNPNSKSPAGAMGLMQLTSDSWSDFGSGDIWDAYDNIMAGTKEFATYLKKYGGDIKTALAAYNWGPGNVDRKGLGNMPSETQDYIPKVLGYYQQFSGGKALPEGITTGKDAVSDADFQKTMADRKKSIEQWKQELKSISYEEVNAQLAVFEHANDEADKSIEGSKSHIFQYNEASKSYRDELDKQIPLLKQKQTNLHLEAESIRATLTANEQASEENKLTAVQVDELNKKLQDLGISWWNLQEQVNKLNFDKVTSEINQQKQALDDINTQLDISKATMELYNETSPQYRSELVKQTGLLNQQIDVEKKLQQTIRDKMALYKQDSTEYKELQKDLNDSLLKQLSMEKEIQNDRKNLYNQIADSLSNLKQDDLDYLKRQHQDQEKALEDNIKAIEKSYDNQIDAQEKKLKLLDDEIDKQEHIKKLNELNDELNKAINDKRTEYITSDGRKILSYDHEKVSELQKQRDELLQQYQRDDIKKAIQNEVDRLKKAKDDQVEILKKQLDDVKTQNQRGEEEASRHWDDLIQKAKDGTLKMSDITSGWFTTETSKMIGFRTGIADEIQKIKDLYASLALIQIPPLPQFSLPGVPTQWYQPSTSGNFTDSYSGTDSWSYSPSSGYSDGSDSWSSDDTSDWRSDDYDHGNSYDSGGWDSGDLTPPSFATGGYTGEFGSDGKLAILHQKELILNQMDTSNILKAVNLVRNLPKLIMPNFASIMGKPNVVDQSKTIHINNPVIKADKPMELFKGIEFLITSHQG
jgi:TP901 family phage tail tape measure protein